MPKHSYPIVSLSFSLGCYFIHKCNPYYKISLNVAQLHLAQKRIYSREKCSLIFLFFYFFFQMNPLLHHSSCSSRLFLLVIGELLKELSGAKIILSSGIFHLHWHVFSKVHFRVWVRVILTERELSLIASGQQLTTKPMSRL